MVSFSSLFQHYRTRINYSKRAVAKEIGLSASYFRQLENQGYRPPTFAVCEKIIRLFKLGPADAA